MTENKLLRSKVFLKKTKRGGILKIVREHYLRDDIWCCSPACLDCENKLDFLEDNSILPLELKPISLSNLINVPHYIIPDTNVVLRQIDILEDLSIKNVILLQTVLDEVRHRSLSVLKRIKDCVRNPDKHFYSFMNEFHKDTYIERYVKESSNDRNDRAIRVASKWYQEHLKKIKIVLLTNDVANKDKAIEDGISSYTVHEYVDSFKENKHLVDKLSASLSQKKSFQSKEAVFPPHLPLSLIQAGLKSGKYKQGKFFASRENFLEASVSVYNDDEEESIFLQGHVGLNRAVQDDIVAVELLPESEWSYPSSLVIEDEGDKPDEDISKEDLNLKKTSVKSKSNKIPTGKVVGIIKRNWRQYCGILEKSLLKNATYHLFKPSERCIPKVRIETRQSELLSGHRIVVVIDSWPNTSRYPLGHFVRDLGNIGDKDTENEVLLLEHDIPHSSWSQAVLNCLPSLPWIISDEERKRRIDLRHLDICSVDPPGCTDIDDALHAKSLPNGNYEVGVHIADVSHFIRPGTALDKEACSRGTTVYLTDKRIDMVPDLLSSNLCSLRGNEIRFAFSCIWELNENGEIQSTKFHKSIIESKAALTYAEAQMRIDDHKQQDGVTIGLRKLNELAKILKQKRVEKGALTLASPEIRFHVDSETHDPIDVQTKQLLETNSMVEEFMLLANISVAEKIRSDFPECALLRRHPAPPPSNFKPLISVAESKGFTMDVNSGKMLADSLNKAVIVSNPYFNTMLRILCTRCMMQAAYFCSGLLPQSDYFHYGLATPIYTHFTSPIRRYSDLMVHRLLATAIGAESSYSDLLDKFKTEKVCENLNYRHKKAQYAGRASVSLHTVLFFRNRVQDEEGYILFVRKNALQVLIPTYGLEGTVYVADTNGKSKFTYNEENGTQTCGSVVLNSFDPVTVRISIDSSNVQHQKLCLNLVYPHVPGFSLSPLNTEDEPPKKKSRPST